LIQVVAAERAIEEGDQLEPVHDCVVLLEKFSSQVFFPILQALQLVSKHLGIDHIPLSLNFLRLFLQQLGYFSPRDPVAHFGYEGKSASEEQMSISHMVGNLALNQLHG